MESNTQVTVRFAEAKDLSICLRFDHCKQAEIIANKISMKEIIVAEIAGQIIGYLKIEYIWSHLPYINLIIIRAELRTQGIGRKMLGFLESYLSDRGHKTLLSSSQVNEPEPQSWHRAMGFQECGILAGINEGGIGEVFFKKDLS